MDRNVQIIEDLEKNKIVVINDIIFKGKRKISWDDVEVYLKAFIGEMYEIIETGDAVYIGKEFPDEFSSSMYSSKLKGTVSKAKANAAQAIPEMIEIASEKRFVENYKRNHRRDAKYGWYRYDTRFALPIYNDFGYLERYNVFYATLIVRHSEDNKLYLYDVINIKKESSTPPKL